MKRFLTGIQPTNFGKIHLGNYLGAVKLWKDLNNFEAIIMIADLHAMTTTKNIYLNSIKMTKQLMACGLNSNNCIIFLQSQVPAHTQLYWVLNNYCPLGDLERMTQFKDKSETNTASSGLLTYPLLQSADILLYNPHYVPIGEDQVQHLELTRVLARKLNRDFKKEKSTFHLNVPKNIISSSSKISSLRMPTKKMSKSDPVEASTINITDSNEEIINKITKAKTDSICTLDNLENRPGMHNLIQILAGCKSQSINQLIKDLKALEGPHLHKHVKSQVIETIIKTFEPIKASFELLTNEKVEDFLNKGSIAANSIANTNMNAIYKALKLWK